MNKKQFRAVLRQASRNVAKMPIWKRWLYHIVSHDVMYGQDCYCPKKVLDYGEWSKK